MNNFCGSSNFWDITITWNTTSAPDFTPCFQGTVLSYIPCAFIWFLSPFEFRNIFRSSKGQIPWTLINIFKIFLATLLCVFYFIEFIYSLIKHFHGDLVNQFNYYSSIVKLLTLILVLILIIYHRKKGIHTSGILFFFWFLFTLSSLINYRSVLSFGLSKDYFNSYNFDAFDYICRIVILTLVCGQLVLSCFADSRAEIFAAGYDKKSECPENSASFLSQLLFSWYSVLIFRGYKKPLTQKDIWSLSDENKTEVVLKDFNENYSSTDRQISDVVGDGHLKEDHDDKDVSKGDNEVSIVWPLIKTFWFQLFICAVLKLVASLLTFVNPTILDFLIAFMSNDEPFWKGYLYAGIMLCSAFTESMFNNQYEYRVYKVGMKMRSAMISAIYTKCLRLSTTGKQNFTTGEIVNLMAVDTQRVIDYVHMFNILWAAPIQFAVALYLLWGQLGISSLAGVAVIFLLLPINGFTTKKLKFFQVGVMKQKDKRIKLMNEILNGIKVLKLYAWESSFEEQINKIRNNEIVTLIKQAYYNAFITFAFTSAPFIIALASFATFVLSNPMNILDANKVFVSLSLFNILRGPMAILPMMVNSGAICVVSVRRISKYLGGDELNESSITHNKDTSFPISTENATFSWSKEEEPILKNISIKIKKGNLVAVVGQVGQGKSSLLSGLLGDMFKISGNANIFGKIAFVPQQAWIQNATLRKNILFTSPMVEEKYQKVINGCALEPDLKILSGGDLTEIGEKGINLSGGQKQRVSLARAVYSDADIYLLDDPLSAVDSHVGKHLFDNIIGSKGILMDKTRILVTHRISFLPQVDEIIVIKDGMVSEHGTYRELLNKKGDFAEFLIQNIIETSEELVDTEDIALLEEITQAVPELQKRISRVSIKSDSSKHSEPSKIHRSVSQKRSRKGSVNILPAKQHTKDKSKAKLIEVETSQVGSVKWSVYGDYLKAVGVWGSLITFFSYAISNGFNIGSSLWLTAWSNDALDPANYNDTDLRNLRLGVYAGLGLFETVFMLSATIVLNLAGLRGSKILHNKMLTRIFQAPMSFFDTTPVGRILNRFSRDIDTLDSTIRFNLRMLIMQFFRSIVALIIMSLETPLFFVALIPLAIIYYGIQKLYITSCRQLRRIESVTRSPVYTHFSETITGATSIRAYGASKYFIDGCHDMIDLNHSSYYASLGATRWLGVRLEFMGYIIVFLSALFAVISRGTLSPGIAGLAISYSLTITATLNMLVRASTDLETNIVSVERSIEYTKTPTEKPWYIESKRPDPRWPQNGSIRLENYSTKYRAELQEVLKHVSFEIKPGEKVGIVGRTGAGKSSLTLALFRIVEPTEGLIYIDDVNVINLGLHDLRSHLTIIPQDPVLFTGLLRMNLDPFDSYSDEEIWKSLELSHLKKFVMSLPSGLQHMISEGGENLSVGQRQLICLARALLRKTKILVLDEATAAVDLETDELIQNTIRKEFKGCTIVTIAHRLNTILDYDRIILMEQGTILEFDSPQNLLSNHSSLFYSMAKDAGLI